MMTMLDEIDDMDCDVMEIHISVHSPVIKSNHKGGNFMSYAVSLKSNNPCFTQQFSCIRRRYSEFVHLRNLLKVHHPNIEPPVLPRKSIFSHFNQVFINERAEGLQNFLRGVANIPVYLSNKAVHLFLQSHCSMSEIDQQSCGEVPAPRLMSSVCPMIASDNSLDKQAECADYVSSLESVPTVDVEIPSIQAEAVQCVCNDDFSLIESSPKSAPVPILQAYLRQTADDRTDGSSHSISPSSSNGSFVNSDSFHSMNRRVSFNEQVRVAFVRNHLWNIAVRPIKAGVS